MKRYLYIGTFIILLFFILSSKFIHSKRKRTTKDTLFSKTIKIPNKLFLLKDNHFIKEDSLFIKINNLIKIYSIVDGTCPKCIFNQLNKTDSVFNSDSLIRNNSTLVFIINFPKQDLASFMRNMNPIINTSGIILWDDNYNFERLNKLFTSEYNLRTFMVNSNNKIIQYGNPVIHPEIIAEYKEKLISPNY